MNKQSSPRSAPLLVPKLEHARANIKNTNRVQGIKRRLRVWWWGATVELEGETGR